MMCDDVVDGFWNPLSQVPVVAPQLHAGVKDVNR